MPFAMTPRLPERKDFQHCVSRVNTIQKAQKIATFDNLK